ncbi:MAG: ABC transporter ATP-binding protein [Rickettsiaceae bacterium]|nr:ABC transporter ATP-binding protein [Rickettsiaceae bacterium]
MKISLFNVFLHLLWPKRYWYLSLVLLVAFLGSTISIDGFLIKNLLDFIENADKSSEVDFLSRSFTWALIYGLWWELCNWLWRLYDYLYLKTLPQAKSDIIDSYFSHTQKHSYNFFKENLSGFVTNKILDASRSFEMIFSSLNEKILRKIFMLIIAIWTLSCVKAIFATIFVIWLSVFFCLGAIFSPYVHTLSTTWAKQRSIIAGKIVDSLTNAYSVRMYNRFEYEKSYLGRFLDNMVKSEKILGWFMLRLRYFQSLSCSLMMFSMLFFLGLLRSKSEISVGDFALVITLCIAVCEDIWDFTQDVGDLFEDIGTFAQSIDLLEIHEISDSRSAGGFLIKNGKIEFQNVTFGYNDSKVLFEEKSVIIDEKQKVALVGFSGSGKTTFTNLIARLYEVKSGRILIDGMDISEVSQESLRQQITVIPQEPILFNRSIMENIRYGNLDATDEEVMNAAKKAYIHDDIIQLNEGYYTSAGERGAGLSGGQRQRIAIARAILKDAPILILDEATSAQDSITENKIKSAIAYLMKNKTVITIAHRISTIMNMDRILVFDGGKIIEDGSHEELYKNSKLYRKLWDTQTMGYISEGV